LIERILGVIPIPRGRCGIGGPGGRGIRPWFQHPIGHTANLEKNLLASDLVAVFQRLSTSWGDQMNSVLQNAILAFLEALRAARLPTCFDS